MSQTIDKRVVEMAFENQQFEKGVGQTIGSVDKLKNSLNFKDADKGFAAISAAANQVSLGSIASGIESLSGRFSALGIMAITTLMRITNSAIDAGVRIARALTIEPIGQGYEDYNRKITSIQTITNATGKTVKEVTGYFDQLDTYADKTIFNLNDMTGAAAKFVNAGVDLDKAVPAIKGIANMVALAGQDANAAGIAFYNLSQSIAGGFLTTTDYRSLNLANVATQEWKEQMIAGALAAGTLKKSQDGLYHIPGSDKAIKEQQLFTEELSTGWATTEVLLKVLGDYGDTTTEIGKKAQSAAQDVKSFSMMMETLKASVGTGWTDTFELLVGDLGEAKSLFTPLTASIQALLDKVTDARNNLLKGWKDLGGRTDLLDGLKGAAEDLASILRPIGEALREIFPPMTAKQLYNITSGLKRLTDQFKLSSVGADKIKRIFKAVFAILDIGRQVIVEFLGTIFGLSKGLGGPINTLTDFLARMADYIIAFHEGFKITGKFKEAIDSVALVLKGLGGRIKTFVDGVKEGMGGFKGIKLDGLKSFMDNISLRFEPLGKIATLVGKFLKLIGTLVAKLAPTVLKLGGIVADGIGNFLDKITGSLENFQPERVFDIINGGLLAGVLLAIRKFINKGSGMFDGIAGVLDGVKGSLQAWQSSLKSDVLLKIAAALGILTLSVIALSMIDSKKLTGALGAMTAMFIELGLSLNAYQKVSASMNPVKMGIMAVGLVAIATSMLVMAGALAILSKFTGKELVAGLITMGALIAMLKIAAKSMSESTPGMLKGAVGMVVFSYAIKSLGNAVAELGKLDVATLVKGLVAVGVLVTELALFMRVTDLNGMGILKAVGVLAFAVAVNLLAFAVSKLAEIDAGAITKGLVALGVIFAEISAFTALTGGGVTLILTAVGVGVIGAALLIFAEVLERIGNLSWEAIAKGLTSIAVALTLIGAAGYLIPPTLALQAVGILIMAEALVIVGKALEGMGNMTWDEIARGLVAMAGSMLILSVAMMAMQGSIVGAAALLVVSAALMALAPALKILGGMSWEEIAKGLVALAGTFLVLGLAGALLTPVVPTLLALGAAMLIIGAGMALAGVGLLAFSVGLAALAVSGAAGAAALVIVITSIVGLVPMLVKTLGRAILALIDTLVAGAPTLLKGIVTFLAILLDGLILVFPKLVTVVGMLIDTLIKGIHDKLPALIENGYFILKSFLQGLANNIGEVATIAYDIVLNFIAAVREKLPELADSAWKFIIAWIDAMKGAVEENLPVLMNSVRELGLAILKGLVQGLVEGQEDAKQAIIDVAKMMIDGFKEFLGIHSPSTVFMEIAGNIIQGLIDGIQNGITSVKNVMIDLANKVIDGLKGKYDSMVSAGRDLITGLIDGMNGYISKAVDAAKGLATAVLTEIKQTLGINSPSDETYEVGKFLDQGLALGVKDFAKTVIGEVNTLGKSAINELSSVISGISDTINADPSLTPTIRPVVDMSEVDKTFGQIKTNYTLPISGSIAAQTASSIAARSSLNQAVATVPQTTTEQVAPVVSFTQNNYSPKELSRIDIYRQTNNQLNRVKGALGAT